MQTKIIILAGDASQAAAWMRDLHLTPSHVMYASHINAIRGLSAPIYYVIVGTFWSRPDANEIFEQIQLGSLSQHNSETLVRKTRYMDALIKIKQLESQLTKGPVPGPAIDARKEPSSMPFKLPRKRHQFKTIPK